MAVTTTYALVSERRVVDSQARGLHTALMSAYAPLALRAVLGEVLERLRAVGGQCHDSPSLSRRVSAVRATAGSYLLAADELDGAGLPASYSTALLREARDRVSEELRGLFLAH
ncbi:MAG: hypothetical protein JF603_07775 [Acidobacteria bacterium]|nr:hypothetical protein [Acidobacteriota bacterium]